MKEKAFLITVLTCVLISGALFAEETEAEELSNTRYAEVDLRITTDPKIFPIISDDQNIQLLVELMIGNQLPESVAKDVLGRSEWEDILEIMDIGYPRTVGGMHTARMKLTVSLDDTYKSAAKEFLEAYIQKLKEVLKSESQLGMRFFEYKLKHYARQKLELEMSLEGLLKSQNSLAGGKGALDKESVRQRLLEHEQKIIENDIKNAMMNKRAEQLVKQISIANAEKEESFAVGAEIRKLEKQLSKVASDIKRLDTERKNITIKYHDKPDERQEMFEKISKQKQDSEETIILAKNEIDKLTGIKQQLEVRSAEAMAELKRQLREVTIRQEELVIEAAVLHGYSPGSLSDSNEYEILEVRIEAARDNLHRATIELSKADSELRLIMPPEIRAGKIIVTETPPKKK